MNKLLYNLLIGVSMICVTSCMEIDNFDEPNAHISGRLIDSTTGENYVTDQGDTHIRIWEMSFSTSPKPQDLVVKMDGNYNNEKLFAGTYDMLPYNGSYWPCDTVRHVGIGKKSVQDFTVTPYLKIKDFKTQLNGTTLTMSCRLFAPITTDLPMVLEVRPFLSFTQYCGNANKIDFYHTNTNRISLRKTWDKLGDMQTGEGFETYTISVELKPGYTYRVRMGANVNDTHQKYNYSEIVTVSVPSE